MMVLPKYSSSYVKMREYAQRIDPIKECKLTTIFLTHNSFFIQFIYISLRKCLSLLVLINTCRRIIMFSLRKYKFLWLHPDKIFRKLHHRHNYSTNKRWHPKQTTTRLLLFFRPCVRLLLAAQIEIARFDSVTKWNQ